MIHLVQFSTGTTSAEVARLAIERYGLGAVMLVTADTTIEDPDNWRFATEAWQWLGMPSWVKLTDGRHPMEVGRAHRAVPNDRWAICSRVLKRELIRHWMVATFDPSEVVAHLGFDWTETDRWDNALKWWPPYRVAAPLMDPPYLTKPDIFAMWRARGVEIPQLNREGFDHANCGGGCVRAGMSEWDRLRRLHPDRFAWWVAQERETQVMLGKNVTILRDRRKAAREANDGKAAPLSLAEFQERQEATPDLFSAEDTGACACDSYRPDEQPVRVGAYRVEWRRGERWAA